MTTRQLERLIGQAITARMVMVLHGHDLWHRVEADRWELYEEPRVP